LRISSDPTNRKLTSTLISGAADFSQETVRTNVGEFVPATGRIATIRATTAIIDQLLGRPKRSTAPEKPSVIAPAETEFFLTVSATESPKARQSGGFLIQRKRAPPHRA